MRRWVYLAVLAAVAINHSACAASRDRGRPTVPSPPSAPAVWPDVEAPPPPAGPAAASGNHGIRSFEEAKKELGRIYAAARQRTDLYCGCTFLAEPGHGMRVDLAACGYVAARDPARAERIEWEHAVPASAFGRTFPEWREGHPRCVDSRGKPFHGRKCAHLASPEFSRIEADLHNLFPVVGEVNGLRSDLPMGVLDPPARAGASSASASGARGAGTFRFGACASAIEDGVFQPRREVRGDLARAYKYMDQSYPERHLVDDVHRPLFDAWDAEDPPDAWERQRNVAIAQRQGNANRFIGE